MSHESEKIYSESVEMYLKEIYLLSRDGDPASTGAIADRLGVSPPSVTDRLNHLTERDLITYEKHRGASLTERGAEAAESLLQKHCRIERFLVRELDVTEGFHEEACRLEHAMTDEVAKRLRRFVDQSEECPDCYDPESQHCSYLSP
ncbi:MAG: metal-dependent transcriptional regulator [Halodesulfurarchaeum sp.]